jgi:hypothetical protein
LAAYSSSTIAILLSAIALIWQSVQFFLTRSSDAKNRQFDAYHRLVKELVQPSEDGKTYVDRQCAAVFELRRFKDYQDVTFRILSGLRDDWRKEGVLHPRLAKELELTLDSFAGTSHAPATSN